jgi:hypothetical protein
MDSSDRSERDAAGVGPYARDLSELSPISSLDGWSVAKGEPDIRGWEVKTVSGRSLGAVRDMLIDRKAGEVVMIDVDLAGTDRHVPVSIRSVHLDRTARVVLMDSADLGLAPLPVIDREVVVLPPVVSEARGTSSRSAESHSSRTPAAFGDAPVERRAMGDEADGERRHAMEMSAASSERRRAERRRIDRTSTDT